MRILLVEDNEAVGEGLQVGLAHCDFVVDWVRDGETARQSLVGGDYAALVLDLGLPRLTGLELLRELRQAENMVPVLVLTARDGTRDKIAGLDAGADDYITKPVDLDELAARLRALVRRCAGRSAERLVIGEFTYDPSSRSVWLRGELVDVSARELTVLETLLSASGRMISRRHLESVVYGYAESVDSNAVEVHVHHLRKKLGRDFIKTVRGVGYVIERPA